MIEDFVKGANKLQQKQATSIAFKYSEDEARDEQGRFTSGGAGARGGAGHDRAGSEKLLQDAGYQRTSHAFNREGAPSRYEHPDHPDEYVTVHDKGWEMHQRSSGTGQSIYETPASEGHGRIKLADGTHANNDDLRVMIQDRPHDE